MQILIAFDKFKDSMPAAAACKAAEVGIRAALGDAVKTTLAPLTDGGEGFCPILAESAGGWIEYHRASGPLGESVEAPLGWVEARQLPAGTERYLSKLEGKVAVIEMASVAGLEQVPSDQRHPRFTTTRGVGELIRIATTECAQAILLGIGGSATSDLGLGALESLGLQFLRADGSRIEGVLPKDWIEIERIEGAIEPELPPIYIACDVDNPLLGPRGAASVYGPQKGLSEDEVEIFDSLAGKMARMLCRHFNKAESSILTPGTGAAGGIGFGLHVCCDANFVPGFELVTAWLNLKAKIAAADLVLSGEGKIDFSSLSGKGPFALAVAADKAGLPCRLFAGKAEKEAVQAIESKFPGTRAYSITPEDMALPEALSKGAINLQASVEKVLSAETFDR
ncbi:glycerate kinase [Coraliomargarita parva]|uniref:glycerate kinase n=1 Tax=Coraliomargarita parva TaxID=3014050 RepID=UPI0022B58FAB|nr:glycerate kinase [Coraliomargarita parva]